MTDNKKTLESNQATKVEAKKVPPKKTLTKATPVSSQSDKAKLSKTAVIALLFSFIAIAGVVGHYVWQQQQESIFQQNLLTQMQRNITDNQQQVNQLLTSQQTKFSELLKQMLAQAQAKNVTKLSQLETKIAQLSQNKPSDWLIHEAEYLVRVAARTMWLERDTQAAIGLLNDADNRLAELNHPKYLPVRQLIHQDIERLQLMPQLDNEDLLLTLMAMNQQIASLPLAIIDIDNQSQAQQQVELSSDIADWQENLAKSWRKFLDTFVVVHTRDGNLEPLLSPDQQLFLRENLSLKIHQAQWAVREEKSALFQQYLNDVQVWIRQYFDLNQAVNQRFISGIESLKDQTISYDYPSTLASLEAIRALISQQTVTKVAAKPPLAVSKETVAPAAPIKTEIEVEAKSKNTIEDQIHQQEALQKAQDKKDKAEGESL